ncbi:uncharacterized protein N7529_001926 [Penicillium soppii]|uniref:uncharacterized protein n=1 Tax=Penicillium soppii TaxID=69789 RepID=UPI0025496DF5|nr:uncharacterized protein N7529_001926 [Penicillium soppii]KAJ5876342.1 hypothetical protein N7529_001926 [Penicillium soppii]
MQFVRKAEEALTGKKDESHESTQSSNHGPHSSNLANKLDPRVDSDRDNRADPTINDQPLGASKDYGTGTGTGTTAAGTTTTGTTSTTGPHKSSILNKLDPRVDSSATHAEHSSTTHSTGTAHTSTHGLGGTTTSPHSSTLSSEMHGSQPLTDSPGTTTHGSSSTNAGPHSSNIANKVDPRVDSDRDNRARHETVTGAGTGLGTTHGTSTSTSTNAGPHDSNIANKVDPRVDSDRDNRALYSGAGTAPTSSTLGSSTGHAQPLTGSTHGTAGPHDSNIANKLDPRVDSDLDSQPLSGTGVGTTTHGSHTRELDHGLAGSSYNTPVGTSGRASGTAATAGPQDSSVAGKLDPLAGSDIGAQRTI